MKRVFLAMATLLVCFHADAQQIPQEEENASEVLYQKVKRPTVAPAEGPDGDEKTSNMKVGALKPFTATRSIKPVTQLLFIEADAPGIAKMERAGVCAQPVVEAALEPVYSSVKAHMPLFLPFKNSTTGLWQGFYYSWDNDKDGKKDAHRAIDYGKTSIAENEDPTFGVYAIAPGKVIDVKWSNGGGNYVTIEHTAPDGYKYRSTHLHLRNGHDNDKAKAKGTSGKYKTFATNGTNSNLCWGTNTQKIAVKEGDNVAAGQFIAYAGNTGSGGIGVILDDDGTFTDNASMRSFNVHLHFEVRVQDTRTGHSGEWVLVDPYGSYNHGGVDCYDLDATTPYARLFAPFYPSFHNVPLDLVNKFWGYYTGMGMALQTVSVDKNGGNLYAAGSFQWGIPGSWYARFYMTGATYQTYFNTYDAQGYRPRQISVTKDGSGNPRFSAIWEKKPAGQSAASVHNQDDALFGTTWKNYVDTKKWHVQEHVDYTVGGKRYHAAVFVNKPNDNGFYLYYGMAGTDFDKKFNELYKNWELKSINVNGNTVGGVWRPKKNNYAAYYGMTSASYQTKFNQASSEGLRLIKVQNYDDNARFSAIWGK
ncbi:peptidoglycan DD-metalloendopeptidase family protein [Chitinophaga sp. SYP-B3965]|uniref:peptidoglycan DD-metalloendopeptidase family protein n=1 Tax=Chitinophaga sp. SYP-B3965 TaxID=2663120 RepID=UPI0012999922|nr:peptidoglycan DD-metalloendopeptidase family protein [Chitinophaga sp. SYP-B3965]MRG44768.1 peptidoglycan DD-metalloendopeptidase family protein [Chitinophaga sp. SYP-B3965]